MMIDVLAAIFFPHVCTVCRKSLPAGALCPTCSAKIVLERTLRCGMCLVPLLGIQRICHSEFPYILGAAGKYDNKILKTLIHALKFQGLRTAAVPLAGLMGEYVAKISGIPRNNFIVIPIPLSRARRRARGFNQSELIARSFAEHFGIPLETACLLRAKHAKAQSETTSVAERKENIRGVFAVVDQDRIARKNIILIDDVTTSGATFLEAAQELKNAGAAEIIALAAAQA